MMMIGGGADHDDGQNSMLKLSTAYAFDPVTSRVDIADLQLQETHLML